jgi:DNA-binding NtrC family response regulator
MTAFGTPETVQGALDRGAYCVLSKPFVMHTIGSLVMNAYQAARHLSH